MGNRSTRSIGVLLAVCLLTVGAVSPGTAAQDGVQLERDSVLMDVHVYENGTAEWRIEYRTRLDDESTTSAFDSLKSDIESDPESYSESFVQGIRDTIAAAENSTGREMEGSNFTVDAEVRQLPQEYGVVTYSFRWEGFAAAASGDRLRVGDALSGFFLGENERLMVSWPTGYEVASSVPSPDIERGSSVVWTGPLDFGQDEPRMTLAPAGADTSPPAPIWYAAAGAALALLLAGAGAYWLLRRDDEGDSGEAPDAPDGTPTNAPDGGLSLDLLSNEERVLRALEQRGGRAKQQEIVDALGWTEAKTSQVISSLREEGKIESFRLGRENVVSMSNADGDA